MDLVLRICMIALLYHHFTADSVLFLFCFCLIGMVVGKYFGRRAIALTGRKTKSTVIHVGMGIATFLN